MSYIFGEDFTRAAIENVNEMRVKVRSKDKLYENEGKQMVKFSDIKNVNMYIDDDLGIKLMLDNAAYLFRMNKVLRNRLTVELEINTEDYKKLYSVFTFFRVTKFVEREIEPRT